MALSPEFIERFQKEEHAITEELKAYSERLEAEYPDLTKPQVFVAAVIRFTRGDPDPDPGLAGASMTMKDRTKKLARRLQEAKPGWSCQACMNLLRSLPPDVAWTSYVEQAEYLARTAQEAKEKP